jgi:hypothetical protein
LKKFSEDNDILAGFFKPGCMYSVMQMVTRQAVTNTTDSNIPHDLISIFREYKELFDNQDSCTITYLPGYSQCLAFMKETISVANINCITESFRIRTEQFIAFKLRQDIFIK